MKFLSLLISLILGAAVLLVFIRPWGPLQTITDRAGEEAPVVPDTPSPSAASVDDAIAAAGAKPEGSAAKPLAEEAKSEEPKPQEANPQEPSPQGPNTRPLAYEQAEAQRSAALKEKPHAIAPSPPEIKRYFKVKVRDAGTLEVDLPAETLVIRLAGIEGRGADETCKRKNGASWPCGAKARAALTRLIRYRAITCTLPPGGERDDFTARCSLRGKDLSTWLVRRGWATPKPDAEAALTEALQAAKTERLGLWAGG